MPAAEMLPHGSCWTQELQEPPMLARDPAPSLEPQGAEERVVGVWGLYISVVIPAQHWEGWGPCLAGMGSSVWLLEMV